LSNGIGLSLALLAGALAPLAAQTARVVSLNGSVYVHRPGQNPEALRVNDPVQFGVELQSGENSAAVIQASDGTTVQIFPDSRVVLSAPALSLDAFLHLIFGSIKVHIERVSGRPNPHRMTTPTAVIAVRGTIFSVFVDDENATMVAVDDGIVAVASLASPADEVLLRRGERTWVRRGMPALPVQAFVGRSEHADLVPPAAARRGLERAAEARQTAGPPSGVPGPPTTLPGRALGRPITAPPAGPPFTVPGLGRRPGPPR
jgi:hypothetical protein